jgi:hypothetical protein
VSVHGYRGAQDRAVCYQGALSLERSEKITDASQKSSEFISDLNHTIRLNLNIKYGTAINDDAHST